MRGRSPLTKYEIKVGWCTNCGELRGVIRRYKLACSTGKQHCFIHVLTCREIAEGYVPEPPLSADDGREGETVERVGLHPRATNRGQPEEDSE